MNTERTLLQLPYETFYSLDISVVPSAMLIIFESVLFTIVCIQMIRFSHCCNIYLKKIIHALIACQLLASIVLELNMSEILGVSMQPFILFTIQEATFLFSSLAYLTVFLFWVDFNFKVRSPGPGIKFLQTHSFGILIFGFAFCYICAFSAVHYYYIVDLHQGWKFSFRVIWWHLVYYCIITPLQLYYSYSIHMSLDKYYLSYSISLSKTKKILHAVNFCFVLRICSTITFVSLYYFSNNSEEAFLTTWPAFVCFYILDQILPASIFLFLLRKSPKHHSPSYDGKLSLLNFTNSSITGITAGSCQF